MKLLRVLHALLPPVKLRVNEYLSIDIRDPRVVHKARRKRECAKVTAPRNYWPQIPVPSALEHALTAPAILRRQAT